MNLYWKNKMRELTYKEAISTRGIIYLIQNQYDMKNYVGKTINTFNKRYCGGKWWRNDKNKPSNILLYRTVQKYGHEQFKVFILEDGLTNRDLIKEREKYWANKLNSYSPHGYNIRECGEGGEFYGPVGVEGKIKGRQKRIKKYLIKDINTQEIIEINDLVNWSKENKIKCNSLRNLLCGLVICCQGFCLPETSLDKIEARFASGNSYTVRNIKTKEITIIRNLEEFCRNNKINCSSFKGMINGISNSSYGFELVEKICKPRRKGKFIYKMLSPNEVFIGHSLSELSAKSKICRKTLRDILNNKSKHSYKDWSIQKELLE